MIFCTKCGTSLPDDAKFCAKCGQPTAAVGGAAASPAPAAASASAPTIAAAGVQELKCPTCGAPIKPEFGDAVITCDYCGGTVTLGGAGWKQLQKHSMLPLRVADQAAALASVKATLDTGLFHHHFFEESKVAEAKLSYVPYWVVPVSASTTYQYEAAAAAIGGTVGTIAAGAALGSALGGRRGGFAVVPIIGGPVINPTRSETISGQYQYPVVAVKAMTTYQPKDYQFPLDGRVTYDKKAIPGGAPVLNGDLSEDAAHAAAKAYVEQLQSEAAHHKHSMVSKLETKVDISDAELLHAPIWYFRLEHKGKSSTILVDACSGRAIHTMV
ncbi:MAG TPA: zinc ribbon domain-containing protein [Thermoplasmata archaeon]|nr:zinc ribbon domain-containing protein [Thermoplasmata archaeon]